MKERFGLAGVLFLVALTCRAEDPPVALAPPDDIATARAIFKELIETDSTHEFGSTPIAHLIEKHLRDGGIPAVDITFLAPPDHPSKGNLIVRLHGKTTGRKPILFLGHLDVVEARREDWTVDPFKLTEKDGFFYGRGSIDMKNGIAALVETLLRLKRENYQPDRDLIFLFTADEEAGGDANGPEWLLKSHRDLIDAALVLNFDGPNGALKGDKRLYYSLVTGEKVYATFKISATSPGGHGSLPGRDNPIHRIAAGLERLDAYRFPVMLSPTTRAYFAEASHLQSGQDAADMLALSKPTADPAAADRLSAKSPHYNAQLRTTCVATLISGGHAEGALPQRAEATIQCRMMPDDSLENVQRKLTEVLGDPQIALVPAVLPIQAPESPLTPEVIDKITAALHGVWPDVPIIPTMATYFTDGRQFRNAQMPSYGVGGAWKEESENRLHGRDERISTAAFDQSIDYAYRLVKIFGEGSGLAQR